VGDLGEVVEGAPSFRGRKREEGGRKVVGEERSCEGGDDGCGGAEAGLMCIAEGGIEVLESLGRGRRCGVVVVIGKDNERRGFEAVGCAVRFDLGNVRRSDLVRQGFPTAVG
jgi:hypothetical protein